MKKRTSFIIIATLCAVAAVTPLAASEQIPGDAVPPAIADPALQYAGALIENDRTASWQLLSQESRSKMDALAWEGAFRSRPSPRSPSGTIILRALATADTPPTIAGVLVQSDEALIHVSATVQITQKLVLVKEGEEWAVDLTASDEVNSRIAADTFLEAIRAESDTPAPPRRARTATTSLPMLRAILAPRVERYRILDAEIENERATVTLASDIPVNVVLRAVRSGPGWPVYLPRTVVSPDPTSSDPLEEARNTAQQTACEEQLQRLATAFQMYAVASADTLPDPERWVRKIRAFLPDTASLQCPADPVEGISYAMNRNLAGKKRGRIANPSTTPLLYESTIHGDSPSGTGEGWPVPPRHTTGNLVLYLDGSVRSSIGVPSFEVREKGEREGANALAPARRRLPQLRHSAP